MIVISVSIYHDQYCFTVFQNAVKCKPFLLLVSMKRLRTSCGCLNQAIGRFLEKLNTVFTKNKIFAVLHSLTQAFSFTHILIIHIYIKWIYINKIHKKTFAREVQNNKAAFSYMEVKCFISFKLDASCLEYLLFGCVHV